LKKYHYYKTLINFDYSKEPDTLILRRIVKSGQSVIDIGANIGVYSKILSECVGPRGRVISLEPISLTYDFLVYNLRKLKLKNIEPINLALSNVKSDLKMVILKDKFGENFYRARVIGKASNFEIGKVINVRAQSLDELLQELGYNVSFIKIDVEGHELKVLKGANNTLSKTQPILLIEIDGNPNLNSSNAFQVFQLLNSYGYITFILEKNKFKKWEQDDISINYFFLTEKHFKLYADDEIINHN
jgi:FkbM family methyltransferase